MRAGELDEGEAEAITLSREAGIDVVLLDEKDARRVAHRLGLRVLGTIGLLIWAKRAGIISSLREQLETLRLKAKFRLDQNVYNQALRTVDEL